MLQLGTFIETADDCQIIRSYFTEICHCSNDNGTFDDFENAIKILNGNNSVPNDLPRNGHKISGSTMTSMDRACLTDQKAATIQQIKESNKQQDHYNMIKFQKSVNPCAGNGQTWHWCRKVVKCLKCCEEFIPYHQKNHVKQHIKEETNVKWLFQCLLCQRADSYHTMYKDSIKHHFQKRHNCITAVKGTHYIDRELEMAPVIEKMVESCFKGQIPYCETCSGKTGRRIINSIGVMVRKSPRHCAPIEYSNQEKQKIIIVQEKKKKKMQSSRNICHRKMIKCAKCFRELFFYPGRLKTHVNFHVNQETDVKWLFQCLLCRNQNSYTFRTMDEYIFKRHFLKTHPNITAKSGTHYVDRELEVTPIIKKMKGSCFDGQVVYDKDISSKTKGRFCNVGVIVEKPASTNFDPKSLKKCFKCGELVSGRRMMLSHARQHLKMANKIQPSVKCLKCHPQKSFLHVNMVKKHLMRVHEINYNNCVVGVDYLDRRSELQQLWEEEVKACFKLDDKKPCTNRLKKRVSSVITSKVACCKMCFENFSTENNCDMMRRLKRHINKHMQAETGIMYLYSCLMCEKQNVFTCFEKRYVKNHLKYCHRLCDQAQLNTHYLSHVNKFKDEILKFYKKCFPDYFKNKSVIYL